MDSDEREIFQFLKDRNGEFTGAMEICRRAGGKKRFQEDPNWAKPILSRMEERNILESDSSGRFRVKPLVLKNKKKQWVAPNIAKILQESGVGLESKEDIAGDDYYDQL